MVDVSTPLGHDAGAVFDGEHGDDRVVGCARAASDVDCHDVLAVARGFGPYGEASAGVGREGAGACHLASATGVGASLAKAFDMFGMEHVVGRCVEGFGVGGGEFGLHLLERGVFSCFVVEPLEHLEGDDGAAVVAGACVPQLALVGCERADEGGGVGDCRAVDFDFVPGDEYGRLVGEAAARARPFGVEIVAHAVGRGFYHHHREGHAGHRAADGADKLLGGVAGRRGPEGRFGEVSHGVVAAADGFLVFGRGERDLASASGDAAYVERAFEGLEGGTAIVGVAFPEVVGVGFEQLCVHASNLGGGVLYVGANERVPVSAETRLDPSHVHLHESGTH